MSRKKTQGAGFKMRFSSSSLFFNNRSDPQFTTIAGSWYYGISISHVYAKKIEYKVYRYSPTITKVYS